ncbi:MAG: serine--tRNA ligase, partial [Candidatus Thermoplasmatota archaeon]|nr:serine--tRNA ligase [Candidatus Thermoplasmatota archaeon]
MLDAKFIRDNKEAVRESLRNRRRDTSILDRFEMLDQKWKVLVDRRNTLNRMRNESAIRVSKLVGQEK